MSKFETINEYRELAKRTCVDLGTMEKNMFHMNTGIITEIGEAIDPIKKHIAYNKPLDLVNVGEEIGDCAWYIANRSTFLVIDEKSEELMSNVWSEESFKDITEDWNKTFDYEVLKDLEHQDKLINVSNLLYAVVTDMPDLDASFDNSYTGITQMAMLDRACALLGLNFMEILNTNIEKLKKRYPEKFTEEGAINRDLDSERATLEEGINTKGEN